MKTVAIIQARLGSTRLPGKVLHLIKGKPLIVHMLNRLKRCRMIDTLVLATSSLPHDRPLLELASHEKIEGFTGSEEDVLDRFYQAAKLYQADVVVRLTGDCPLIDPTVTDLVIERHLKGGKDYTSNTVTRSYPRGLDTEAMSFNALKKTSKEATKPYEREHVTPYIFEHPDRFSIQQVVAEPFLHEPGLRLTVDTPEDFALIQKIFDSLYDLKPNFSITDVVNLLNERQELRQINAHIQQKLMTH